MRRAREEYPPEVVMGLLHESTVTWRVQVDFESRRPRLVSHLRLLRQSDRPRVSLKLRSL
jgi:hypothetical protein